MDGYVLRPVALLMPFTLAAACLIAAIILAGDARRERRAAARRTGRALPPSDRI